jgi:hypothetical protein
MRLIGWGLLLVVLGYIAYAVMMSAQSYLQVAEVVDHVVSNPPAGSATNAAQAQQAVLARAAEAGLQLDASNVIVSEMERGLHVKVTWRYPVMVIDGSAVQQSGLAPPALLSLLQLRLAVPLSHSRRMELAGATR